MKDAENPVLAPELPCCPRWAQEGAASAYLTYPDPAGASGTRLLYNRAVLSGQSPAGGC